MISGRSVALRPTRKEDLDELYQLTSDLSYRTPLAPVGLESFVDFSRDFEKNGWWFDDGGGLVITLLDGTIVGNIGCRRNGVIAGYEVGYQVFKPEFRGHGYMSEALELFSVHMFDWKPIPRLYALVDPRNKASIAVAIKCHFVLEGTMRSAIFARGAYHDLSIYARLRAAHGASEQTG